MKGLIYKELAVFFKSIDRRTLAIACGFTVLIMFSGGAYAGMLATVMFSMSVAIQNVLSFEADEKAGWEKYQRAMPVSAASVVAGKYISVVCTLALCLAGSVLFNLISSVLCRSFDAMAWGASLIIAVLLPLLWTGLSLPLTYWFGFRAAQTMGILAVFPVFYFVKYFEDGDGLSAMTRSIFACTAAAGVAAAALFLLSMLVSVAGYRYRRRR